MLDAPWSYHWPKYLHWTVTEAIIIARGEQLVVGILWLRSSLIQPGYQIIACVVYCREPRKQMYSLRQERRNVAAQRHMSSGVLTPCPVHCYRRAGEVQCTCRSSQGQQAWGSMSDSRIRLQVRLPSAIIKIADLFV